MFGLPSLRTLFTGAASAPTEAPAPAAARPSAQTSTPASGGGDSFYAGASDPGSDFAKWSGGGSGGRMLKADDAEAAVAKRAKTDKPLSLDPSASTVEQRIANASKLTQLDGDKFSKGDQDACGVQSMVAGMYIKNPGELKKVAAGLQKDPAKLEAYAGDAGLDPETAKKSLKAIENGSATPQQLSQMSALLYQHVKADPTYQRECGVDASASGLNNRGIGELSRIVKNDFGATVPPMTMHRTIPDAAHPNEGHWLMSMSADGNPASNNRVVFDPWANDKGEATVVRAQGSAKDMGPVILGMPSQSGRTLSDTRTME